MKDEYDDIVCECAPDCPEDCSGLCGCHRCYVLTFLECFVDEDSWDKDDRDES